MKPYYKNPIFQLLAICIIVPTFLVLLVICGDNLIGFIIGLRMEFDATISLLGGV